MWLKSFAHFSLAVLSFAVLSFALIFKVAILNGSHTAEAKINTTGKITGFGESVILTLLCVVKFKKLPSSLQSKQKEIVHQIYLYP